MDLGSYLHFSEEIRHATKLQQARQRGYRNWDRVHGIWTDWIGHKTDPIGPTRDLRSRVGGSGLLCSLYCRSKSYFVGYFVYLPIAEKPERERSFSIPFPCSSFYHLLSSSSSLLPLIFERRKLSREWEILFFSPPLSS